MKPGIGEMVVIDSIWGHWAGGPGDSIEDVRFLNKKLREVGLCGSGDSKEDVKFLGEKLREVEL